MTATALRTTTQQNIITHVMILGDATPSVDHIKPQVVETINNLVKLVAQDSAERKQEVRVTLYTFNSFQDPICRYYDMDALRVPEITVRDYVLANMTALKDATAFVIDEMHAHTWQKYGDHSFLLYVVTDGQDNQSETYRNSARLRAKLENLPGNWTVGVQVPDARAAQRARDCGFADGNIDIWETTAQGAIQAGQRLQKSYVTYAAARSQGIRKTTSLFQVPDLAPATVKAALVPVTKGSYILTDVRADERIDEFMQRNLGYFEIGRGHYELTKPVTVQDYKNVYVLTKDGQLYGGGDARHLLGLPDHELKIKPGSYSRNGTKVFIQSTAPNRKLIGGTQLLTFR